MKRISSHPIVITRGTDIACCATIGLVFEHCTQKWRRKWAQRIPPHTLRRQWVFKEVENGPTGEEPSPHNSAHLHNGFSLLQDPGSGTSPLKQTGEGLWCDDDGGNLRQLLPKIAATGLHDGNSNLRHSTFGHPGSFSATWEVLVSESPLLFFC